MTSYQLMSDQERIRRVGSTGADADAYYLETRLEAARIAEQSRKQRAAYLKRVAQGRRFAT